MRNQPFSRSYGGLQSRTTLRAQPILSPCSRMLRVFSCLMRTTVSCSDSCSQIRIWTDCQAWQLGCLIAYMYFYSCKRFAGFRPPRNIRLRWLLHWWFEDLTRTPSLLKPNGEATPSCPKRQTHPEGPLVPPADGFWGLKGSEYLLRGYQGSLWVSETEAEHAGKAFFSSFFATRRQNVDMMGRQKHCQKLLKDRIVTPRLMARERASGRGGQRDLGELR